MVMKEVYLGVGRCDMVWESVITLMSCDSPLGGVTVVRKVCQLIERCGLEGL